jgi:hypothetical protein
VFQRVFCPFVPRRRLVFVRSELYEAVEEATQNEYALLAQLGGGGTWAAFLGRPLSGRGPLAILLLQEAEDDDGEFDLETVEALDAGLPLGRTTCHACGQGDEGWPRFCPRCGADLTGIPADAAVPGGSAEELLEEVRGAAAGVYDVLGDMPHAEGGGPLYFAREAGTGRVVGLALRHEADGDLDLAVSWTPEGGGAAVVEDRGAPATSALGASVVADPPPAYAPPAAPAFEDAGGVPAPPSSLFDSDGDRARRSSRERTRRVAGIAAIAVICVALVGAAVLALQDPPLPDVAVADSSLMPAPKSATPAEVPAAGDEAPPVSAPPAGPPRTVLPGPATFPAGTPSPAPRTDAPSTAVPNPAPAAPASTPPVAAEPPAAPAAPTARGIEDAIGRYAAAVQSRQTSRITRAYPGITSAEVERWERFFRPLRPDAGLQARTEVLSGPSIQGRRGEVIFTLTLSYEDASGSRVETPLPLRGVLDWTGSGWTLQAVYSLQ